MSITTTLPMNIGNSISRIELTIVSADGVVDYELDNVEIDCKHANPFNLRREIGSTVRIKATLSRKDWDL